MTSTRPLLEAVRSLLHTDRVWVKGNYATSASGLPVGYWDSRACHFSLTGAVLRCSYITGVSPSPAVSLLQGKLQARHKSPRSFVTLEVWNDAQGTSLAAVIELLNEVLVDLGGEAISPYPTEEE
jgi:hypothetical protein